MRPEAQSDGRAARPGDAPAGVKLSVMLPFHHGFGALRDALLALERQTYPREDYEIVAIDNDPGMTEVEALKREFPRVRWVDEPVPGAYSARNTGVAAATGEWLAFTDSDCLPDRRWLEAGARRIARGDADMIAGRVDFIDPAGRELNACERLEEELTFLTKQRLLVEKRGVAATANLFARRELFDRVGGFDTRLMSFGDGAWTLKAAAAGGRLVYEDEARVRHPRRSRFRALAKKLTRVAGDRVIYNRVLGLPWQAQLAGLWQMSLLHPGTYVLALRSSRGLPLAVKVRMITMGLAISAVTSWEKIRVLLGGRAIRG